MSIPVCKFYSLNQSCRFGRHCKFLHSTAQRPPPYSKLKDENEDLLNNPSHSFAALAVSDNQQELNTNQDEGLLNAEFVLQQFKGQDFSRSSNVEENADETVKGGLSRGFKKQRCYYFSKYGSCRFGDGCRYSHIVPRASHGYDGADQERYGDDGVDRQRHDGPDRQGNDGGDRQRYDGLNHQKYDGPNRQKSNWSGQQRYGVSNRQGNDGADQQRHDGASRQGDDGADRQRHYGTNRQGNDGADRERYNELNHQRYERPDRQGNDREDRQKRQLKHKADIPPRFRKPDDERDEPSSNVAVSNDTKPRRVVNETNFVKRKDNSRYDSKRNIQFERRVCPFFKSGRCNRGDNCRFIHASDQSSAETNNLPPDHPQSENEIVQIEKSGGTTTKKEGVQDEKPQDGPSHRPTNKPVERPLGLKQIFTYAELDEIGVSKVRDSEISVIKKRFPRDKFTILEETDSKFSVQILFSPTDPEWPFDVHVFELKVTVPQDYPKQMMSVELPVEQNLPETVRRYVEVSIKEWLDHKEHQLALASKVELVFRPFLRWLDRSIEDITTDALKQLKRELVAKAAGMEFLSAQKLQEKFRANEEKPAQEEEEEDDNNMNSGSDSTSADETTEESADDSDEDDDDGARLKSVNLDPEKKGTEVELRHLQLREKASALMFEKIKLVLQCGRCKQHSDLLVAQNKVMSVRCEKCNQNQFVHFRPALVHQFSSVIGYLDLDGCQAFDLIFQDCRASVTCMNCGKCTRMDGLVSGQMVDGWCQACNARFKLATEAVKFSQLVPSAVDTSSQKVVEVESSKQKKPPKDPAIKEGNPLPEFGTCKHYKHSYRWLRFPCCGKAYPCDVCHDKKEEHEMVRATRMICGHCCKEQNFSATRPCNACGQHLTKIRTAHWEGGSGCRDRLTMSKSDQQKYKSMNKTLSNHLKKVQAANSGKRKKTTSLRHS